MVNAAKETVKKRLNALKSKMIKENADAFIVTKAENKYYLTCFHSTSFDIIITQGDNYLLTDFRYIEAAQSLKDIYKIIETNRDYGLKDFLKNMEKQGLRNIALEFKDASVDFYRTVEGNMPSAALKAFDGVVEKIRSVKDDAEIEYTAEAERIGDEAFSYILGIIRPGISEKEIALRLELKMRELGASGLSFDTICVSGVRTSLPHGEPSEKLIEPGDFVTMDFGCRYMGYCSDMTRTVAVGRVSDEQRSVYETVLRAQLAGLDAVRAGAKAIEVDAAARRVITDAGCGEYFGHGTGHGTGLEIHEAPTANTKSKDILEENMLLTVEPGIYMAGRFGVRIEDLCVVKESGIIDLTKSEKRLIVID